MPDVLVSGCFESVKTASVGSMKLTDFLCNQHISDAHNSDKYPAP